LFFFLLEFSLRYFNYGRSYEQWLESPNGQWVEKGGKLLILNPDIAYKYFHTLTTIPHSTHIAFDKEKKPNAFRIFIIGGSSAAGFPYEPNGSVARYIQDRLSLVYPDSKIEIINCSMTAINSYTLRDLTPGILDQKPDLILIYAGHNEYYGALGAGSIESFGNIRFLVNLVVSLEKYRTFQLIRNTIAGIIKTFSTEKETLAGTLMEKMVQNKYIVYGSDVYKKGLSQFEGNLNDILQMITDANVPVIIGTITSNLKDQYPFVSDSSSSIYPPAENIFIDAKHALSQEKFKIADSLFRYARDLDALRFRAPDTMNDIISRTAEKYSVHVVDIDSAFNANSPYHIVGNNLIIDHLHPSLQGYQLMGKMFFEKMKDLKYLPNTTPKDFKDKIQDSITVSNLNFSKLDSVLANFKIRLIKNNWPFVKNKIYYPGYIPLNDQIDSLAMLFIENKINWIKAHLSAGKWYYDHVNIVQFLNEIDALIHRYPDVIEYPDYVSEKLLVLQKYDQMYSYLLKSYAINPGVYSTKWLGTINLYNGNIEAAKKFLNESLEFNNNDSQVLFNMALAYYNTDKLTALEFIDEAIAVEPNYKKAIELREIIKSGLKSH
jgi:lysophospholipase L1-like esterase